MSCCWETFLPWYWSPTSLSLSVSQSHQPSCSPCLVVGKRFFPNIGHLLLSLSQSLSLINPLVPRVLMLGNVSSLILVTYFSLSLSLSVSSTLLYPVSCCWETFLPWYWSPTSLSQSLSLINPLVPRVLLLGNVSSLILVTYFSLSLSVSSTLLYPVSCCWETFLPWYWSPTSLFQSLSLINPLVARVLLLGNVSSLILVTYFSLSVSQSLSLINPLVARVLLLGNVSSLILVTYFSLSLSVSQSHQPSCSPCLVLGKRFFPDIGHLLLSLSLSLSVSSTLLYPVSCCWETFLPWYWSPTSLSLSQSLSLLNPLVARVLLLGNVSSLILVTYFSLSLSVSQSHQPSCTPCLVVGKRFFPDIGHLLLSLSLSLSVSSTLL